MTEPVSQRSFRSYWKLGIPLCQRTRYEMYGIADIISSPRQQDVRIARTMSRHAVFSRGVHTREPASCN